MLYGCERHSDTVPNIINNQLNAIHKNVIDKSEFIKMCRPVTSHCKRYVSKQEGYAQILNEEQERELEAETENEQQIIRPKVEKPHKHGVDQRLLQLLSPKMRVHTFDPISTDIENTSFEKYFEQEGWSHKITCSRDFQKVVEKNTGKSTDYLRPIKYLITYYDTEFRKLILISDYEANELLPYFTQDTHNAQIRLQMYSPRLRPDQRILIDMPELQLPLVKPTQESSQETTSRSHVPPNILAQLSMLSGNQYFSDNDEKEKVCDFLGFCLRPWTEEQQKAFDENKIHSTGFIPPEYRVELGSRCNFKCNPTPFFQEYILARTRCQSFSGSHVGSIFINATRRDDEKNHGNEKLERQIEELKEKCRLYEDQRVISEFSKDVCIKVKVEGKEDSFEYYVNEDDRLSLEAFHRTIKNYLIDDELMDKDQKIEKILTSGQSKVVKSTLKRIKMDDSFTIYIEKA
ncbi:hypothetical protein AKO1_004375 [Acrasis kona]|uniref:Uncharacterized protein n=1 Tax=Acrasis kona TaxID=1008807 RepID=A0AAW2Z850_9EUKA